MKIISAELESELTELCARDLFIMIWCCSGQCVRLTGTTQLSHPHQATLARRLNHQQVQDLLAGLF